MERNGTNGNVRYKGFINFEKPQRTGIKQIPEQEYFEDDLLRLSKNEIVWGGNYFGLPATRCFLVCDLQTARVTYIKTYAECELAWSSFDK